MPNAKKYWKLKSDTERYRKEKQRKAKESAEYRLKHPFKRLIVRLKSEYGYTDATPLTLFGLCKQQKCKCVISGRKLTTENISVDHIIPVSKGGSNRKENFQLTTKEVNYAKNSMTLKELRELCKDILTNCQAVFSENRLNSFQSL